MNGAPMSVPEVAKFIGLSQQTVYQLVKHKKIPHSRIGERIIFLPDQVLNWIKSNEVKGEVEHV